MHGIKSFSCPRCKKKFSRKDNLARHSDKVHKKRKIDDEKDHGNEARKKQKADGQEEEDGTQKKKIRSVERPPSPPLVLPPPAACHPPPDEPPPPRDDQVDGPNGLMDGLTQECKECYKSNWKQIQSRHLAGKLRDVYTFRLDIKPVDEMVREIFAQQTSAFKINMSFGYILKNSETGEARYYYPSQNGYVFDSPSVIRNEEDLAGFMSKVADVDWQDYVRQQKPNSKWIVALTTNVAFTIYKLPEHPIGRGQQLPKWVVENRGLDALEADKNTGRLYKDNLCYFRCLGRYQGCNLKNLERKTKQLAEEYLATLDKLEDFQGVKLSDLYHLDEMFGMHTFVYCLQEDGTVQLIHRPAKILTQLEADNAMKINLCNGHFSYIKDMKKYAKSYQCSRCDKFFKRPWEHERHERTCEAKVKYMYPGGVYHPPKAIFEKIGEEGIPVPEELKYSKYRATYDIEVYYPKVELPENTSKLEWTAEHRLLSISVASNVPSFENPKCFVVAGEEMEHAQQLVGEFVNYLNEIAVKAYELEQKRYANLKSTILTSLTPDPPRASGCMEEAGEDAGLDDDSEEESEEEEETEKDREFIDDDNKEMGQEDHSFYRRINQELDETEVKEGRDESTHAPKRKRKTKAQALCDELDEHMSELPVIGFNSGKYDINVLKEVLIPHLVHHKGIQVTIKKHHTYLALKSGKLKFLDVSNFLAAGTSYSAFLKAYQCQGEKGFFPYEYVESIRQLEESQLPPREAFKSWLRNTELSKEDYAVCQRAWEEEGMETLRDFLKWYNKLDVEPFLEALEKMTQFWKTKGIDMLKQAISLPGLAFKFEMSFLKEQGVHLSSFHDEATYQLFRKNMVGGPAIIFKRYAEVNKTNIRNPEKTVKKIIGYDANGLYLWALCQPMPVGLYTLWRYPSHKSIKLEPTFPWRAADEWLSWVSRDIVNLRTRLNNTEKRLGDRQVPVDGYDASSNTPYEFMGCYWHGCVTCFNQDDPHPTRGETYAYWNKKTQEKLGYLEHIGYRTVVKWECEWRKEKRGNAEIEQYLNEQFPGRAQHWQKKSPEQVLQEVKEGKFFGAVEVDIDVPEEMRKKFEEMTPIFKNTEITRDVIGPHMRQFAEDHEIMSSPRRALIGSYKGEKILLATPLLKFYLEEGLKVTRVYQAIQWTSKSCFGPFGDFVSESRREADADPHQKILGETAKTVGNAGYGRFLMDVTRHQKVAYEEDEGKVTRAINSFFFRDLEELPAGVYEIKSAKKRIKCDLPIQIGYFVYQYAKLRMLEFYYRCIDKYLARENYEYLEMDTDSAYMSLAGDSIGELVKPELREEWERDKNNWFPREDTKEHAAYDKRTPGLFKVEWEGQGFVGLNSKTYCCWGEQGNKASCKGISKRLNDPQKEIYLRVLKTRESEEGENRGFRVVNNRVLTYSQHRSGFSYFYAKRKVLEDGISTVPLSI